MFSHCSLVWNGDYYYVVGYSDKHQKIGSFHVDRIESTPEVLYEMAVPMPESFNISEYTKAVFQMYDEERATVELKCTADMMKVIIDRFGEDIETKIIDEEHFKVTVWVSLSPNFYGYLFGFGGKIELLALEYAIENTKYNYLHL